MDIRESNDDDKTPDIWNQGPKYNSLPLGEMVMNFFEFSETFELSFHFQFTLLPLKKQRKTSK